MVKMPREPFQEGLSCSKCETLAKRVFELFFNERSLKRDRYISLNPQIRSYMIIDWLCCANEKCKNWFNRYPNISRCPVCHYWSVSLRVSVRSRQWKCLKTEDCGWTFSIIDRDKPRK